ncbi:MAG: methyltransferase domain-containing protein [Candidatus Rokuibacteriota bacterium]
MTEHPLCWCGNADLAAFGAGYWRCSACQTLVSAQMPGPEIARVTDEEGDLYGREYWFSHQEEHLGQPSILARARSDLSERCLHWLRTVLKYKQPPADVLELGCAHGGFVAMLRWAGFDATGLEISGWVVDFAQRTFDVPVLRGPLQDQDIPPASLDVIVLMDVLEHLHDPSETMGGCLRLLKPDGILLIQTPRYPERSSYEDMVAGGGRFLEMLQPAEHLYLFSRASISALFSRLGTGDVVFEPAFFAEYDMFLVVGRGLLTPLPAAEGDWSLSAPPTARLVRALLDLASQLDQVQQRNNQAEEDRARRLTVITEQGTRIGEVEAERSNLRAEVTALHAHVDFLEADRAARLRLIEEQGRQLGEMEAERSHLRAEVTTLRAHADFLDADQAARLRVVEEQGRQLGKLEAELKEMEAEVEAQHQQIQVVMEQLRTLQHLMTAVQRTRVYRLLRRLGRWRFIEQAFANIGSSTEASGDER